MRDYYEHLNPPGKVGWESQAPPITFSSSSPKHSPSETESFPVFS